MDLHNSMIEGFNRLAAAYQEKFMDFDLYDDTYDHFCSLLNNDGASVFEIGCGPGNITRYLLRQRPDLKIHAIDLSNEMVALAQSNNPSAIVEVMDCRTVGSLSTRYDAIVSGFCLPYLSKGECQQLIKDSHKLLNEGGVCYFSAIEGSYDRSGYQTTKDGEFRFMLYLYDEAFLVDTLSQNGFDILSVSRRVYPMSGEPDAIHIIVMARKCN